MVSAHALTRLHGREGLKVIIGDSPFDYRDVIMAPLPGFMNRPARGIMNIWQPRERTNTGYGKFLLEKLFVNAPKDDAIEVPSDDAMMAWHGEVFDERCWKEHVDRWARAGLSGHKFTMWQGQVRWMLNQRATPTSGFSRMRNMTVRQPQAAAHYESAVREVIDVSTAHCGTLEGSVTWNRVMKPFLSASV